MNPHSPASQRGPVALGIDLSLEAPRWVPAVYPATRMDNVGPQVCFSYIKTRGNVAYATSVHDDSGGQDSGATVRDFLPF